MIIFKRFSDPYFKTNWILIIILFSVDVFSKILVRKNLPLFETTELLKNFLDLTHVQNRGVSFSLFSDLPDLIRIPFLVGVSLIAILGMMFYQFRYWNELDIYTKTGIACVLPGAAGNLVDRAFFGYVTDFLHFHWYEISFFVNNLADCFISLGVIFFIVPIVFSNKFGRSPN